MDNYTNYGLSFLMDCDKNFEYNKKNKKKDYNKKNHEELKAAIYLLKQQFMVNKMFIDVDLKPGELKNIVESQYITMKGKTWSVPHHEIVTLQINKGKGRLTITEVVFADEEKKTLKAVK